MRDPCETRRHLVEETVLTPPPLLLVSAGLLRDDRGRVLLSQRRPGGHHGLCWEFPGGKVEAGETPEAALIREFREEVGVTVGALTPWTFVSHDYEQVHLLMVLFHCRRHSGTPRPLEVEAVGWFTLEQMRCLEFPPADRPLLDLLLANPLRA